MTIESVRDYAAMSSVGASIIFDDVMRKISKGERYNLGLATGNTMITLYDQLAEKLNRAKADLSLLSTWNLDEYSTDGKSTVPHDHPLSYWKYMHEKLFSKFDPALGFNDANAHFPEPASCGAYDPAIEAAGGLDLQLLGIGFNGHIAFNEPFTSLNSRTGVRALTEDTLIVNSRFFGNDVNKVPKTALSVGVGTVCDSKQVMLLISGHNKARALRHCVEGGVDHAWTISALQLHKDGIIVCDEPACGELKVDTYKYFKEIYKNEK